MYFFAYVIIMSCYIIRFSSLGVRRWANSSSS